MPKKKRSTKKKKGARSSKQVTSSLVDDQRQSWPTEPSEGKPLYERYKAATHRFKSALSSMVPENIFNSDSVQNLVDAADYVADHDLKVDKQILLDLRLAIASRKRYSQGLFGDSDEGHAYFVLVLNYCLQTLKPLCDSEKSAKKDVDNEPEPNDCALRNKFAALDVDVSDDEVEDATEVETIPRPEAPAEHISLSSFIETFCEADLSIQFIDTMDASMSRISRLFANLKETMRMVERGEYPRSIVVREILALGGAVNLAISTVRTMEDSLEAQYPHLNSSHRIIACAFLSKPMKIFADCVRKHSPIARKFGDQTALIFVSDIVECIFRAQTLALKEIEQVVEQFNRRWRLPEHWAMKNRWLSGLLAKIVMKETMTDMEREHYGGEISLKGLLGDASSAEPEPWLDECEYIGGDRSILNTLKLMDIYSSMFTSSKRESTFLFSNEGGFRHVWDENASPAKSIRRDMDHLLFSRLLNAMLGTWMHNKPKHPHEQNLLPLVDIIRAWTRFDKPTKLSAAFGVHAILTSIFEVQGNGDLAAITKICQTTCTKFMDQVQEQIDSPIQCHGQWKKVLKYVLRTKWLMHVSDDYNVDDEEIGIWNPVVGSMFLSYIIFGSSLDAGAQTMENSMQATFVLHLFNALKKRELVEEDLPLVSTIDSYFKPLKALWNGWDKPEQGKFVYRYTLRWGTDHEHARYQQEMLEHTLLGGEKPEKPLTSFQEMIRLGRRRTSSCIHPRDFSNSYKSICLKDFSAPCEDDLMQPMLKRLPKQSCPHMRELLAEFLTMCSYIFDEYDLLVVNFLAAGGIFNECVNHLFPAEEMNGGSGPRKFPRTPGRGHPRNAPLSESSPNFSFDDDADRVAGTHALVQVELAKLDYMEDEAVEKLAGKFANFFNNLDPARYQIADPVSSILSQWG